MSNLSEIYITAEKLETILKTVKAKGEKGVSITLSTQDETNQYGQNVSAYISQTKEQREAKADRYYIGNGKVFWTDGSIKVAEKKQESTPAPVQENKGKDELPF